MKEAILFCVTFILIVGLMICAVINNDVLKQQCKSEAFQKNYSAIEIQAVCGR